MDFDFSDDQKALQADARRFLASLSPLAATRALLDGGAGYDAELWRRIARQGWCGTAIPERFGGLGLSYVELCALAEELGRALAPVPFASGVYQFAEALLLAGSEDQRAALLPGVAAGTTVGTLAVSEGPGTPARLATVYADGRLSGAKIPVVDALAATHAVVLAAADAGPRLVLVDLAGPGVAIEPVAVIDPSRGAARVTFDRAPAWPLGDGDADGIAMLRRIDERAAVPLAFEQLGLAERCLELARDYALERYAFGRPIGGYQAIKHKLADVYVRNSVARANAYYGAWALSAGAPELPLAAAQARVAASAAAWIATKEAIQTHGGIGVTWDHDLHLFFRRARHLSLLVGASRLWKRRLVEALERQAA